MNERKTVDGMAKHSRRQAKAHIASAGDERRTCSEISHVPIPTVRIPNGLLVGTAQP